MTCYSSSLALNFQLQCTIQGRCFMLSIQLGRNCLRLAWIFSHKYWTPQRIWGCCSVEGSESLDGLGTHLLKVEMLHLGIIRGQGLQIWDFGHRTLNCSWIEQMWHQIPVSSLRNSHNHLLFAFDSNKLEYCKPQQEVQQQLSQHACFGSWYFLLNLVKYSF